MQHLHHSQSLVVIVLRAIVSRPSAVPLVCRSQPLTSAWQSPFANRGYTTTTALTSPASYQGKPYKSNRPRTTAKSVNATATKSPGSKSAKSHTTESSAQSSTPPPRKKGAESMIMLSNNSFKHLILQARATTKRPLHPLKKSDRLPNRKRRPKPEPKSLRYNPDAEQRQAARKPRTLEEFNRRIHIIANNNQHTKATKLLYAAIARKKTPSIHSFTTIISGCCRNGQMQRANKWVSRLEAFNLKPDVHIYTSLMDGYMREGAYDKAEAVFRSMISARIQPTLVTYNVLMHHSMERLDIEAAVSFFTKLRDAGLKPDVYSYAILIHGLGDANLVDEAWRIYESMKKENIAVDQHIANCLMSMHVAQRDNGYALQLFDRFFASNALALTPHTGSIVINALLGQTSLANVLAYYARFTTQSRQSHPLPLPDNQPSLQVTDTFTFDRLMHHTKPSVYIYTVFMRAFLRHNAFDMVTQAYQDMLHQGIKPTSYTFNTLMLATAFEPNPESCEQMLQELISHNAPVNVASYTIVMRAWAKANQWPQVKRVYEEMKHQGIQPNKETLKVLRWAKERSKQA
ncbi:hypothetical protein DM01DRAFT_1334190 [Hesseltinella vesiculosa]|uniref:Pentacotripeptide-repeat region of PRORP domain-containing protein n=1 Tax=Hesseltinella vesiculosa TaxID=101127 RepID=A0A1X2GN78_9FUNG|nr:hypothetical protein DM01DRAFT_1334190 [Hesseltinella vesiculosa]